MPKHKVANVRTRGTGMVEKIISYRTEKSEFREIRVKAEFEGAPMPEEISGLNASLDGRCKKPLEFFLCQIRHF